LSGLFSVPNQWAIGVNAQGDIAGYTAAGEFYWAYVIQNGVFQDLSAGYWASWANALNSKHQVVGAWSTAFSYDERALYWHGSQSFDLNNSLPPNSGWMLNEAVSINENGLIVGNGTFQGQASAFGIAAPTPGN
jgi:hypothetical protein